MEEEPGITQEALAERLGVTPRTVRAQAARANEAMAPAALLVLQRRAGYVLEVADPYAFVRWQCACHTEEMLFKNPRMRRIYLMTYLLMHEGWVTLRGLEAALPVSRTTLSKDLIALEPRLASYGLSLTSRPCHGTRVEGPEVMRRACLVAAVSAYGREPEGPAARAVDDAVGEGVSPAAVYEAVRESILEVIARFGARLNTQTSETLYAHAYLSALRALQGADLEREPGDSTSVREFASYPLAHEMVRALSQRLGIILSDEEAVYLAVQLGGRLILGDQDQETLHEARVLHRVREVAQEIAQRMRDEFAIDITHDEQSMQQLLAYLAPLSARLRFHVELSHTPDERFFQRYYRAHRVALMASEVIARRFAVTPSEAEVYHLTVMFALMLTHLGELPPRQRVLVVYHQSPMAGTLLASRLEDTFPIYIASIETCEFRALDEVDLDQVDVVIATAPLERALPVPVRVVSVFLDEADADAVGEVLHPQDADAVHEEFRP